MIEQSNLDVIEIESEDIVAERGDHGDRRTYVVSIYNELDGRTYRFRARAESLLRSIIDAFLERIGRARMEGDRLFCDSDCSTDNEDVFQFEGLTVREYLDQGHCPKLDWIFAGNTGGA